jgi:hypothetical protein
MDFQTFYKSVFAILRIDTRLQHNNVRVVGSAFVINTNPLRLITCHHVISEADTANNAPIVYSITKRSDPAADFDLRNVQISYLRVRAITHHPDVDLAVLEVDPATDQNVAQLLRLNESAALALSFDPAHREPGEHVEWLSTAATGDVFLTPRFFRGQIVTRITSNNAYTYLDQRQQTVGHVMQGVRMLEVDKLFIPGVSGSPIVHTESGNVISYVHGYRAFPVDASVTVENDAQITYPGQAVETVKLKHALPLVTTLSLAIDLRSAEALLRPLV